MTRKEIKGVFICFIIYVDKNKEVIGTERVGCRGSLDKLASSQPRTISQSMDVLTTRCSLILTKN